jgi:hypothetical protein
MATIDVSRNPTHIIDTTHIFTGNYFAFTATGGFEMAQGFETITQLTEASFNSYDMTNAVQVLFDVKTFNTKLGITKDADNSAITATSYDEESDAFPTDSITISAAEFKTGIPAAGRIVSVGKYSTLFSDFINYIHMYFGYAGGFASIFNSGTTYDICGGVFNTDSLYKLINQSSANSGNGIYVNDLSGSITISNINQLLRYAVDGNIFSNRDPSGNNNDSNDASDPSFNYNYGVGDGFMAGDLIFVPSGTKITLNLNVAAEAYLPINNIGPSSSYLETLRAAQQSSYQYNGYYTETTTASLTNINRVVTAPLLIRLANL